MEGTPLRSVPARVPGPVDPADALAHIEAKLPDLDGQAQRALALVELGRRPRDQAADELGMTNGELSRLLALGRKALRRTVAQLPAGGWCERAERLMSDRLDGVLAASGAKRLDAHLQGCERCATHERKLGQAHDLLVTSFVEAHVQLALEAGPPPAELRLVEESTREEDRRLPPRRVVLVMALLVVIAGVVLALLAATGVLANVP